jgi:apolipoprotein N-acyltransferase
VLNEKNGFKIAPAICYESIYGDFMSRYVKQDANLICVITNDGWWKNTPGHKQHMNYARLRAIETVPGLPAVPIQALVVLLTPMEM